MTYLDVSHDGTLGGIHERDTHLIVTISPFRLT